MSIIGQNILAGASGAGGYTIDQSLRFEDGSSTKLAWTAGTPTDNKKWTVSLWFKRANIVQGQIFSAGGNQLYMVNSGEQFTYCGADSGTTARMVTTQVFRDPSAWYHLVFTMDTTQAAFADQQKLYINGTQVTAFSTSTAVTQNINTQINSAIEHTIGVYSGGAEHWDGYMAEFYFVDGQALTPPSFGETNEDTNQWVPIKYEGTYGNNGFYLKFEDSANLGNDSSGNGNDFTPSNLNVYDQVLDTPTNNFATLNPLSHSPNKGIISEGNLKGLSDPSNLARFMPSGFFVSSGKWYCEVYMVSGSQGSIGICPDTAVMDNSSYLGHNAGDGTCWYDNGTIFNYNNSGGSISGLTDPADGDIWGILLDLDDSGGLLYFYQNDVLQDTTLAGDKANSYNLKDVADHWTFALGNDGTWTKVINFGQDSSFAGYKTAQGNSDGNGKGDFYYTPPAGYLALCSDNLADPSIALPAEHFNTTIWTGNVGSRDFTGVGFQPDLVWSKQRSGTYPNLLVDSVREAPNTLISNTGAGQTAGDANGEIDAILADGFSTINGGATNYYYNQNGDLYVAWNWLAGCAPTVDNSAGAGNTPTAGSVKINGSNSGSALAGSIAATRLSANTTAGFSIIKYTGNTTAGATVAHGLSQAPDLVIVKELTNIDNWMVYSSTIGNTYALWLNETSSKATHTTYWNDTSPNATVVTLGSDTKGNGTGALIMYAIHSIEGYSKVGSYEGNASADGPFIYTGFRPAMIITKNVDANNNWHLYDDKRLGYNADNNAIWPNENTAVQTDDDIDILSNGFKQRRNYSQNNANTYMYMAFAESSFKTSNAR